MVRVLYVLNRQRSDDVITSGELLTSTPLTTLESQYQFQLSNSSSFIKKRDKLMFLKTHKCGTSSLVTILYLYGIRRNLNFLLTPYEHQFFNDKPVQKLAPGQEYDILCQHHRETGAWDYYRPWVIHPHLPKNKTFYFTILRDPEQQFLSNFFFYHRYEKLKAVFKIAGDTPETILKNYLSVLPKKSLTCSNIINPMSFDLGFTHFLKKTKDLNPEVQILSFIKFLDREFDLIMITDEFDKSLILLKYFLSWNIEDVVYLKKMTRTLDEASKTTKPAITEETLKLLRFHNRVDIKVFHYFRQKFVAQLGSLDQRQVEADLEKLQELQVSMVTQCLNTSDVLKTKLGTVFHPLSQSGRSSNTCRLWTSSDVFISKSLAAKQDPDFEIDGENILKKSKNVKYKTIQTFLKLFEGIRSDYLKSSGVL